MHARLRMLPCGLITLLAACATARPGLGPGGPHPTSAAITAADLRVRVEAFAHDSMTGRSTGTPGDARATAYIASQLAALGLEPAGDDGTYFQRIPFVRRTVSPASVLEVDGRGLRFGTDWAVVTPRFDGPAVEAVPVVFWGRTAPDTLHLPQREEAAGRLVVFELPPPAAGQPLRMPFSYFPPGSRLERAAAVAYVVPDSALAADAADAAGPARVLKTRGPTALPSAPVTLWITRSAAEALLRAPLDRVAPRTEVPAVRLRVTLAEEPIPARNVVAVLRGGDPARRGRYVALGAHSDHLGKRGGGPADHDSVRAFNAALRALGAAHPMDPAVTREQRRAIRVDVDSLRALRPARPDSVYNGADDDASGSMALLEIAEWLRAPGRRPRASLLFVWHTGEEAGLLGARHFTDHPTVPRDSIVAQLNLDMIGRGGAADVAQGGPGYLQVVGARRLSPALGELVEETNRGGGHGFRFDYAWDAPGHPERIYCRSDHAMYARYGIPIAFLTTGLHPDYHQVTDDPEHLDYAKLARVAAFVADLAARAAALEQRLPVAERPDPNAPCRQ